MSVKEVERANETNLVFGGNAIYGGIDLAINCIFGDILEEKLPKNNIYSCYKDRVYIFGKLSGVIYYFFDNEFYEYNVTTPVSDYSDAEKILKALKQRFGEQYSETISNDLQNKDIQHYTVKWNMPVSPLDIDNFLDNLLEEEEEEENVVKNIFDSVLGTQNEPSVQEPEVLSPPQPQPEDIDSSLDPASQPETYKEKVRFSFNFPKNKLKEGYYNLNDKDSNTGYISVVFLPMLEIIEKKKQKEQDSYF